MNNLSNARENVSITTCTMWTRMLQNIKKSGGEALFLYSGTGSCATLPVYSNKPASIFIGDV